MPDSSIIAAPALFAPSPALLDNAALFLDFDGTLVPIADRPDAVCVDAELFALLHGLAQSLDGRLAIVSGRSVATLTDLGLGDFILAGTHGLEIAMPGQPVETPVPLAAIAHARARFEAFACGRPGLLVEEKALSVGLHFRQAPQWADDCERLATGLAEELGLFLQRGKMLFELRPGGADKGSAIAALMRRAPMAGAIPLFFGDDVTDEEGFVVAAQLGGHGVLIGEARPTAARYRLEQVGAVRRYLAASVPRAE